MARPRNTQQSTMLNVRIPQWIKDQLQALAYYETGAIDPNISELSRQIIEEYLSNFSPADLEQMQAEFKKARIVDIQQRINDLEQR